MKTNKEIVDLLVSAILKKCKGLDKYENNTINQEIECTIDDINYFMFVQVWKIYSIDCCIIFDLWDVHGSKIKTNKNNIRNEVERQIIKYYENN